MRKLILILITLVISLSIQAQMNPKKIKSKVDYTHEATRFVFPLTMNQYCRAHIYAFDKKRQNIGITYKTNDFKTIISIYLYPAGAATEDRLRDEYFESINSIAITSKKGLHAQQHAVSYKNGDYKINGFKADIKDVDKKSSLSIFECGEWFFKIRITSEVLDTLGMEQTEQNLLDLYDPTRLVKISHLNPKADISFAKAAFVDSLMLGSTMGSAFKKLEWAMDNIDSLERASGFPGLYLDMHMESLKAFTEFQKKHPDFSKTKLTEKYLGELNSIIANGFLEEFIMEQFDMIMIIPEDLEFDFDAFDKWKKDNPISINLNERFYVIWFS